MVSLSWLWSESAAWLIGVENTKAQDSIQKKEKNNMKGFELSERFFREIGLPAIEQQLPECVPGLAVGVGLGSQAHKKRR